MEKVEFVEFVEFIEFVEFVEFVEFIEFVEFVELNVKNYFNLVLKGTVCSYMSKIDYQIRLFLMKEFIKY